MNNLVNVTEFANLYDQYRLDYVVQKWYLRFDTGAATPNVFYMPRLLWTRDLDSGNTLTSAEIRERSQTRQAVLTPNRPIVIKYKPNLLREVFATTSATTWEPCWGKFIDWAVPNATHYGHATVLENFSENMYVDIETKYYFSCKQAR